MQKLRCATLHKLRCSVVPRLLCRVFDARRRVYRLLFPGEGECFTPTPAVLAGSDRATVRVESGFSDMIDLRDSLTGNDERGIVLAASRLEEDEGRLITARAVVGGRKQSTRAMPVKPTSRSPARGSRDEASTGPRGKGTDPEGLRSLPLSSRHVCAPARVRCCHVVVRGGLRVQIVTAANSAGRTASTIHPTLPSERENDAKGHYLQRLREPRAPRGALLRARACQKKSPAPAGLFPFRDPAMRLLQAAPLPQGP